MQAKPPIHGGVTRSTRRGEGDEERMGGRRQCEKRRIREGRKRGDACKKKNKSSSQQYH